MRVPTASRLVASSVLMVGTIAIVRGADEPSRLDQVLARWEAKASTWKTVNVRFNREERSKVWGVTNFEGVLLLKDERTAALDLTKRGDPPALHERIVWTGPEFRQFDAEKRQIFLLPRPNGDPVRLPDTPCVPFLFGRKTAELKERFDIRLEKDDERTYVIRFEPRKNAPSINPPKGDLRERFFALLFESQQYGFSTAYLELDKETLLPRAYILIHPNRKDRQTYRVTSIRLNEPIRDDIFEIRAVKGWKVITNPAPGE